MRTRFLRLCLYALVADKLLPDVSVCERLRAQVARVLLGANLGRGVRLRANIDFGNDPSGISIGEGCYINRRCTFFADWGCRITLGRNVWLGPEVMLWTGTHEVGPSTQRCGPAQMRPIVIEDGCWLGARTTVLAGVKIGAGSVIGACALVAHDVASNVVSAGIPAKVLQVLDADPPPVSTTLVLEVRETERC